MPLKWADGAARLDALLRAAKLSSARLARELQVDPSTINKYRHGTREPDATTLAYMIGRAGGSADEVLGLSAAAFDPRAVIVLRELAEHVAETRKPWPAAERAGKK